MSGEEIRAEREALCDTIRLARARLNELQLLCDHKETFVGSYAFERTPNIHDCAICAFCMKPEP